MTPVGGQHVGLLVPGRIRWHVVVDLEAVVGELLDHQLSAFLGEVRHHEMHGFERGIRIVHGADLRVGAPEVGMVLPFVSRRAGLGAAAQPILEGLQVGVLAHQVVERGAAGAGQSANHNGPFDGMLKPFWNGPEPLLRAQAPDQNAQDHLPRHGVAVVVEPGLLVVAVQQDA